ncbi:MAG: hypothetical protein U0694_23125 [Anaerolineae bacterium]
MIINNGNVGADIHGDTGSSFDGSGDDVIVNGTVSGNIYADSVLAKAAAMTW